MANGLETHEWRISDLEQRMKSIEAKIQNAIYVLIANLIGVIGVLAKLFFVMR